MKLLPHMVSICLLASLAMLAQAGSPPAPSAPADAASHSATPPGAAVASRMPLDRLDNLPQPKESVQESKDVDFTLHYRLQASAGTTMAVLTTVLPRTLAHRQEINEITYSHTPQRVWTESGNTYARFCLSQPRGRMDISIRIKATLYRYDLSTARQLLERARVEKLTASTKENLRPYLCSETWLETDSAAVRNAAAGVGKCQPCDTARKTFDYALSQLRYSGYRADDVGAEGALRLGDGDCTEFADLLVALCRAKQIPARFVDGYVTAKNVDVPGHNWTEIYVDGLGWVPFDPLQTKLGVATFDKLPNMYIHFSSLRNDPVLDGHHYWLCTYQGAPVQIEDSFAMAK